MSEIIFTYDPKLFKWISPKYGISRVANCFTLPKDTLVWPFHRIKYPLTSPKNTHYSMHTGAPKTIQYDTLLEGRIWSVNGLKDIISLSFHAPDDRCIITYPSVQIIVFGTSLTPNSVLKACHGLIVDSSQF